MILARQITHKNVIRIFDLGQADGFKFITMDYIEGEDLQSLLRRKKKLEPAEAANIIAQTCRALEAAHAEGVIHRDLKPQNIMLDKRGRAYVMDFGIARSTLAPGMTQTGALIGTPDYMSPEQAKGQTLDARSDLFSVGIRSIRKNVSRTPRNYCTRLKPGKDRRPEHTCRSRESAVSPPTSNGRARGLPWRWLPRDFFCVRGWARVQPPRILRFRC